MYKFLGILILLNFCLNFFKWQSNTIFENGELIKITKITNIILYKLTNNFFPLKRSGLPDYYFSFLWNSIVTS